MKKIFLTFLVITTLGSYHLSEAAEPSCRIDDGPASVVSDYIKNNRTVIRNITEAVQKSEKSKNSFEKGGSYAKGLYTRASNNSSFITKTYNKTISWESYFSYFNYYILFPVLNEIPSQVKRDHRLLEAEGEGLNKYLQSVIKKGHLETEITGACNGVEEYCKLSGNAGEIIGTLIQNNSTILDLYRKTVMPPSWINNDDFRGGLILVKSNFEEELEEHYGNGHNCNEEKGTPMEKVKKLIKSIKDSADGSKQGRKNWVEAWSLVNDKGKGIDTKEEKELERKLLAQELARQGVPSDAASASIEALNKTNEEGFSWRKNNPITNTFNYLYSSSGSVKEQIKQWSKDVFGDLNEGTEKSQSINSILDNNKLNNIDLKIASSIAELYSSQIPMLAETEVRSATLEARMTKLHEGLNLSIKTLSETCEDAVKVCNQQDTGKGNCGSCN